MKRAGSSYVATAVALGIITLSGCAAEGPADESLGNETETKVADREDWGDPVTYPELGGALQVDLSVTPQREFGPTSSRFRLLWGTVGTDRGPTAAKRDLPEIIGYAAHHVVRARVCIERGRVLQAEYWINSLRDELRTLACERRGLWSWQAREADLLPGPVKERLLASLPRSHDLPELTRALTEAVDLLLAEGEPAPALRERLRELRG